MDRLEGTMGAVTPEWPGSLPKSLGLGLSEEIRAISLRDEGLHPLCLGAGCPGRQDHSQPRRARGNAQGPSQERVEGSGQCLIRIEELPCSLLVNLRQRETTDRFLLEL
jgi:hypothetical protein